MSLACTPLLGFAVSVVVAMYFAPVGAAPVGAMGESSVASSASICSWVIVSARSMPMFVAYC